MTPIRSPGLPAGQWFIIHDSGHVEPISAELAQALGATLPTNGDLTPALHAALTFLSKHVRPVPAGKLNNSGNLSKLKQRGLATNSGGKWSITPAGKEALND